MQWIDPVVELLWSTPTFITLLALGVLFTIWTRFIQFRAITHGVSVLEGRYDDKSDPGAINHFQAPLVWAISVGWRWPSPWVGRALCSGCGSRAFWAWPSRRWKSPWP